MTISKHLTLIDIATALKNHTPKTLTAKQRGHAAVAMILKEGTTTPEVLFIIRATHEQDPWSGNIGFPGGKLDSTEEPQQAAERETDEELSLNLQKAKYLGRLDDLHGATLPVLVSCFVYQVTEPVTFEPNHEVANTFWTPLPQLLDNERHQQKNVFYRNKERNHPAVKLLPSQQPVLWGITYRLIRSFFEVCDLKFGSPETFD